MNNLIFFVLLKMLFETNEEAFLLEAVIKHEFIKRYKKRPTNVNLTKLYQSLIKSGKYDDLPWEDDPQKKKGL